MLSAAQQLGIPTVLVQHGFLGQHWLHHPVMADRVCVFGEVECHGMYAGARLRIASPSQDQTGRSVLTLVCVPVTRCVWAYPSAARNRFLRAQSQSGLPS